MNKHYKITLDQPTSEAQSLPFWQAVKDCSLIDQLLIRIYVRERALHDLEFRDRILQMCEQDICFFAFLFAVFHETREGHGRIGKFVPLLGSDQADVLALLARYSGKIDVCVEKSRGIGLSYLICVYCLWKWLFAKGGIKIGLLSKEEFSLDILRDPGTLMGKLDCLFSSLPAWMTMYKGKSILQRTLKHHQFRNIKNSNAILGYVPTDEKLRSDRLYCLFSDESAFLPFSVQRWLPSAHGTVPSIIYVSTHNGTATMFYRFMQDATSELVRISTWWTENARCRQGLYKVEKGRIVTLDPDFDYRDYEFSHTKFVPEGWLQSLYTDRTFRRPGADIESAKQELYGVGLIDSRKMFSEAVRRHAGRTCLRPVTVGTVNFEGEFTESDDFLEENNIRFWQLPGTFGSSYMLGCDPAIGTAGGAYTSFAVMDLRTGIIVISGRLKEVGMEEFAQIVIGVAKLITGGRGLGFCKIIPETTGVNVSFTNELHRLQYPAIWKDPSGKEGVHNRDRGEVWLTELGRAVSTGDVTLRDSRVVGEMEHFEYDKDFEELLYAGVDGHGDLAIATSLAFWGGKDRIEAARRARERTARPENRLESEPIMQRKRQASKTWASRFER